LVDYLILIICKYLMDGSCTATYDSAVNSLADLGQLKYLVRDTSPTLRFFFYFTLCGVFPLGSNLWNANLASHQHWQALKG
jgi:hypothetical protein